jgi:hypothetical protein
MVGGITGQDLSGYAKLSGAAFTGDISATNLSGTNTGDQDLSGLVKLNQTIPQTVTGLFDGCIGLENGVIVTRVCPQYTYFI